MKLRKCHAPNCDEKHKSMTKYCAKHAHLSEKHVVRPVVIPGPHLAEDFDMTHARQTGDDRWS